MRTMNHHHYVIMLVLLLLSLLFACHAPSVYIVSGSRYECIVLRCSSEILLCIVFPGLRRWGLIRIRPNIGLAHNNL